MLGLLASFAEVDLLVREKRVSHSDQARYWDDLESKNINIIHPALWFRVDLICKTKQYDWVLAEFWSQAECMIPVLRTLKLSQPNLKLATDSVDIHFLREFAELSLQAEPSKDLLDAANERKRRELAVYNESDLVLVVTEEDRIALRDNQCFVDTEIIPVIVDSKEIERSHAANTLLFIGGFGFSPNVDAVLWFAQEVFPKIRSEVPNAVFRVVGSNVTQKISDLSQIDGVEVVGFVKDTITELQRATVSVAPLRFGAGMKGKVTEALSYGIPVVTTSYGAQGLSAINGKHMLVSDDANQFAKNVCECLKNPEMAQRMGSEGKALISQLCSSQPVKDRLRKCLEVTTTADVKPASLWIRWRARLKSRILIVQSELSGLYTSVLWNVNKILKK
jgi:glycosyltransferase involved in cell wall biosynthesis